MQQVRLGRGSVRISRVVLGCMFAPGLDDSAVARIVHAACAAGITAFDTAPLYGFEQGEQQLGRALRDRRQDVQLLTKAGLRWDADHGRELFAFTDPSGRRRVVRTDSRPEMLRRELADSCRRLGVERIDLLQLHRPDDATPIAESIGALVELQQQGQIAALGVSNYAPLQLRAAIRAAGELGVAALQSELSLLERWPERELLPMCREHDVSFLAFSPLAKGILAQRAASDAARRESRFANPLARHRIAHALQGVLRELASAHAVSCAQIALAWLLARPGVGAVVVGASSPEQARDVGEAAQLVLRQDEVAALDASVAGALRWLQAVERIGRIPVLGRAALGVARALDSVL